MLQGNVPSRGGTAQQNPQGRETEEKPGAGLDPLKEDLTHNCAMLGNHSFLCSVTMAGARSRAVNTAVAPPAGWGDSDKHMPLRYATYRHRLRVAAKDAGKGCVRTSCMLLMEDCLLCEGAI